MLNKTNVHQPTRVINTMCPYCAAVGSGFIDYDGAECPVECDVCEHRATLVEWEEMFKLTHAVNTSRSIAPTPETPKTYSRPPMNEDGTRTYQLLDTDTLSRRRIVKAVQSASLKLPFFASYTWERIRDDVELIVLDGIKQDAVAIVEFAERRVLILKHHAETHIVLRQRIEKLAGWEVCVIDGMIAQAAAQWVFA